MHDVIVSAEEPPNSPKPYFEAEKPVSGIESQPEVMARNKLPNIPGLPERYKLERRLSRGPYSEVLRATNRERNMAVALKLLRADDSHAEIARAMFRREVEALKGLDHVAIVQILDWFEVDDQLLGIELELIPGGASLSSLFEEVRIGRLAPPALDWRVRMAAHLADGVLEAHRRHVIHRDIKPGNVLWNRDDDALKLADFGIAAVLSLTARDPSGMTLRNFFSRPFASPEQMLQKAPGFPSDVYGFGLLVAALLALRKPEDDFERTQFDSLLQPAVDEFQANAVPAADVEALCKVLKDALLPEPSKRPSLTQIRDSLLRIQNALVPRPQAAIVLTTKAQKGLNAAGFVADAKIVDDFNSHLRIKLERDNRGELIKVFGRSLYAVLRTKEGDEFAESGILAVDAGQNPGPTHESHRRTAVSCPVRLRLGRGSSAELLSFARQADSEATQRATAEIIERARLIIQVERERLPVFAIEAVVEGGQRLGPRREDRIGRASGYTGSQHEKVSVSGGFRLRVKDVRLTVDPTKLNVVRAHLQRDGIQLDDLDLFDDNPPSDWYAMFDNPRDIDILDVNGRMVGKVTGYNHSSSLVHIQTDKKRKLPRSGFFFVKNYQKERQLRMQEMAIDALARRETVRADMPQLLAESAVHRMGDKPWVDLLQQGLIPKDRVRDLVDRILASQSVFCLQGPPGTGKTTIIAEVVAQALELDPNSRILICAQANDAVANAVERVLNVREHLHRDWIIVRDVRAERAREEGPWSGYESAYREFVKRVKTALRTQPPELPEPALKATSDWLACVEHRSHQVGRDYHGLVQVWGTTTARSTAPLRDLDGESYDLVIIDEAAKATVAEVLVPIVHARKLLLVGDEKQLPPFLENTTTEALEQLGVTEEQAKYSLFEHLLQLLPVEHRDMLNVQFRMHPTIGGVVSRLFYEGKILNGPGTANRPLPSGDFNRDHRVMWLDVVGQDYKVGKTSRANDEEREVISRVLTKLDVDAQSANVTLNVAVIAAYRGQADKLATEFRDSERWKALNVKAATVDAFQGREADVVLYSLVRTGSAERKFIADGRRFNVALSRARSLLVLIGDRTGARGTAKLQELLEIIPKENQISADGFVPGPSAAEKLAAAWGAKSRTRKKKK